MNPRFRFLFILVLACFAFPERSPAPVVFKPGEKVEYRVPGDEEVSGEAQELFAIGQKAEADGNYRRGVKAYEKLVRNHKRDVLAPEAAFQVGALQEKREQFLRAAKAFRVVVEQYPQSPRFDEAIEAQFRIGEMFLNGKRVKFMGIPMAKGLDRAMEIFAAIVRTAPYGKYTARAQFNIGLVREKQGLKDQAVAAYQAVLDKFPDEPVAADAQYQLGYIWYNAAEVGTRDSSAISQAKTGFEDFLARHPKSEKAAQARENLNRLEKKENSDVFGIARFYDKRKNYKAAVMYYNDVIRQQPGSQNSEQAKKRIAAIREKVGDAALEIPKVPVSKKKTVASSRRASNSEPAEESPEMRADPNSVAPLPPPEADEALPPPPSLEPDTTTAPASSPAPFDETESSPAPEASATPSE